MLHGKKQQEFRMIFERHWEGGSHNSCTWYNTICIQRFPVSHLKHFNNGWYFRIIFKGTLKQSDCKGYSRWQMQELWPYKPGHLWGCIHPIQSASPGYFADNPASCWCTWEGSGRYQSPWMPALRVGDWHEVLASWLQPRIAPPVVSVAVDGEFLSFPLPLFPYPPICHSTFV